MAVREGRPGPSNILLTLEGLWCGYMLYWLFGCITGLPDDGLYILAKSSGMPRPIAGYIVASLFVSGAVAWIAFGMGLGRAFLWAYGRIRGKRLVVRRPLLRRHPLWIIYAAQSACMVLAMAAGASASSGALFSLMGSGDGLAAALGLFLGAVSAMAGIMLTGIMAAVAGIGLLAMRAAILWFYDIRDGRYEDTAAGARKEDAY